MLQRLVGLGRRPLSGRRPPGPAPSDAPLATAADPRPLLGRAEQALARYRAAVEELADARLDGESFRRRTHGLRIGVVVDGEDAWLYDPARERWLYGDGARLGTYATDRAPEAAEAQEQDHTATRIVNPDQGSR